MKYLAVDENAAKNIAICIEFISKFHLCAPLMLDSCRIGGRQFSKDMAAAHFY